MLPYRIEYASLLAEAGLITEASQVSANVTATFNSLGGKIPPALLVARAAANELQIRLQTHAQVGPTAFPTPSPKPGQDSGLPLVCLASRSKLKPTNLLFLTEELLCVMHG